MVELIRLSIELSRNGRPDPPDYCECLSTLVANSNSLLGFGGRCGAKSKERVIARQRPYAHRE
jgi:hypothetical protein